MDATVVTSLLTALLSLLQNLGVNSTVVTSVISTLVALVPILVKEYQDVLPTVKNIISILASSDDVTSEQLDTLDELEAIIDAAFDSAVTNYTTNHGE